MPPSLGLSRSRLISHISLRWSRRGETTDGSHQSHDVLIRLVCKHSLKSRPLSSLALTFRRLHPTGAFVPSFGAQPFLQRAKPDLWILAP
jgi:hypothetical protein